MSDSVPLNDLTPPPTTPSTPPKTAGVTLQDTPLSKRTQNNQYTKSEPSQGIYSSRIEAEDGNCAFTVDNLASLCFGKGIKEEVIQQCISHLERLNIIKRVGDRYDYPTFSSTTTEHAMYGPICEMFNQIGSIMKQTIPSMWVNTHNSGRFSTGQLSYPDVCLVWGEQEEKADVWDVLIPMEVKPLWKTAAEQVIEQYCTVASEQINRCFGYSLSLRYPNFTLFRLDRAGLMASPPINMETEPDKVVNIIATLMTSSPGQLGYYDATLVPGRSPGGPWLRFRSDLDYMGREPAANAQVETETANSNIVHTSSERSPDQPILTAEIDLKIGHHLKKPRGWMGRCTYVGVADHFAAGRVYALKCSWQDPTRISEGRFYLQAREAGVVIGLAEIVGYQELPSIHIIRMAFGLDQKLENRIQCRLLLANIGKPLEKATSVLGLLEAVRDALICHRDLFEKAKLLHRDVSYHNIMLNDVTKHPKVGKGMLIDLELAKDISKPRTNIGQHGRTGTLVFMAAALLENNPPIHSVHHDLESFLWVLLYTWCDGPIWLKYNPDSIVDPPTSKVVSIFRADNGFTSVALKQYFINRRMEPVLSSRFQPLEKYIQPLCDLFFDGNPSWPTIAPGNKIPTHADLLGIIDQAISDEEVIAALPFRDGDWPTVEKKRTIESHLRESSSQSRPHRSGNQVSSNQSSRKRNRSKSGPEERDGDKRSRTTQE